MVLHRNSHSDIRVINGNKLSIAHTVLLSNWLRVRNQSIPIRFFTRKTGIFLICFDFNGIVKNKSHSYDTWVRLWLFHITNNSDSSLFFLPLRCTIDKFSFFPPRFTPFRRNANKKKVCFPNRRMVFAFFLLSHLIFFQEALSHWCTIFICEIFETTKVQVSENIELKLHYIQINISITLTKDCSMNSIYRMVRSFQSNEDISSDNKIVENQTKIAKCFKTGWHRNKSEEEIAKDEPILFVWTVNTEIWIEDSMWILRFFAGKYL